MIRRKAKKGHVRKQVGLLIDPELWREFRSVAVLRGMTASELAEEAFKLIIKRRGKQQNE